MSRKVDNYLRLYRRRSTFTQKELAFLLGYRAQSIGSLFERRKRRITLATAFCYSLIFGVEPKEMFPALFLEVQHNVARRMQELHDILSVKRPCKTTATKLRLLEKALARANNAPPKRDA